MKVVLVLTLMVLISSCSSTHLLLNYNEIKEDAEGENATIKLNNGNEIAGTIIEINADSTFNKNLISKNNIIIPVSEIKDIQIKDHWTGALQGI